MDILPTLRSGQSIALCGPHAARAETMLLIAELGLRGPVTILDGGNRYQPRRVAFLLGLKTKEVAACANRLHSRRAFTCYEMTTLLASTPSLPQPYVILDLLNTFYDDHTPLREAERLLQSCLNQLRRLRLSAPVVITLAPPLVAERAFFVERVCEQADKVFTLEAEIPPLPTQLNLFQPGA
jgi:hypothetical protein